MALFEKRVPKEEFAQKMREQTKSLAIRTIRLYRELPQAEEARVVGRQLLRSATSTAANYRAVCRARSEAEYFAKLSITVEEADESALWLEIIAETEILPSSRVMPLHADFEEITAILSTARKTTST